MMMKSTKKKSLQNKAKRGEKQHDVLVVKTECEPEEEVSLTNGAGLIIQIKEEPLSLEISEEHNGPSSCCSDTKDGTEACRPDVQQHIKEESDSEHHPDLTEAAVKEEPESGIKEETHIEQQRGGEATIHIKGDYGEGEKDCKGRISVVYKKQAIHGYYCRVGVSFILKSVFLHCTNTTAGYQIFLKCISINAI